MKNLLLRSFLLLTIFSLLTPQVMAGTSYPGGGSSGGTTNSAARTYMLEQSGVFEAASTDCSTDVTAAAEAFAEANDGKLFLESGCYLMSNYNPDSDIYIHGIGAPGTVIIKAPERKSAILYEPSQANIVDSYVSIVSLKEAAGVNDNEDYLTRIEVADASAFTPGRYAHLIAQAGQPHGATTSQITGVTNANPGVVTYAGSDYYSNGDVVTFYNVSGMTDLNNRSFKVSNVNTGSNTFELEDLSDVDVNTTNWEVFAPGGEWVENNDSWKRVTSITNANPGVVTAASVSGLANGDTILFRNVVGMTELNHRVFKVAGLSGSTFELQTVAANDVDTTDWGIYQDTQGQFTEAGGLITAITKASPAVVTTNTVNRLSNGDVIQIHNVHGMEQVSGRIFEVSSLSSPTFELETTGLTSADVDSSSYGTFASQAFIVESDRWTGESMPIASVDTENNYIYLRGKLAYPDLYKSNALISEFNETRKGAISNIHFEANGDTDDRAIWYRPHVVDVTGVPNMIFQDISGGENWAGLTICRSCPGHQVINQRFRGNASFAAFDPYYDSSVGSISDISNAAEAIVTRNGHGRSDGQAITIRGVEGMTEINEGSYVVSDADTNTFKIKDLKTGNYVDTTGYGTYTSGGTIYHRTERIVSSVSTATPAVFTTSTSHGYTDGDEIYFHGGTGDFADTHNQVFFIDQQSGTTFNIYDTNGVYYDGSGKTYSANTIRTSDSDIKGLSYGHSVYGPSYGARVSVFADGGRHTQTTDGMSGTWASSSYHKFGQPTYLVVDNAKSNGGQGPAEDDHEESVYGMHLNTQVINSLRGKDFGSYIGMGSQLRGLDTVRKNMLMWGGNVGIRQAAFEHYRSPYNTVSDFDIRGLSDYGSASASPQSYCLKIDSQADIYNRPILNLTGKNYCSGVARPIFLDDYATLYGRNAELYVDNIGKNPLEILGDNVYVELGKLKVDFRNYLTPITSQAIAYTSSYEGNTFLIDELDIVLGDTSSNPASSALFDVGSGLPYTKIGIGKLKIQNPSGMTTIPPMVASGDYYYVDWQSYGPDKIILGGDDESTVLTMGTGLFCTTITENFMPIRYVAKVSTVDATQVLTFDITKNGTTIFGANKLSIDTSEKTSITAATPPTAAADMVEVYYPGDEICYDIDTASPVGAAGAKIEISGYYLQ